MTIENRCEPVVIASIQTGKAIAFGPDGTHVSAIDKRAISGAVFVSRYGLKGDEQADRKHHGGPEMAVHHYPLEHYEAWRLAYPEKAERFSIPGAFGENISTRGLTEETVCIGDVFAVGATTLQVSQGRRPCWKLNLRFGIDDMAVRVQKTGRTGWYYRVLEEGSIAVNDMLALRERPNPDWPLSKVLHHLYVDTLNDRANEALARLRELSPSWREFFSSRLENKEV